MKIHPSGRAGFTLTEVLIVAGIIGLLAELAVPNYFEARKTAQRNTCINNIRQIDTAKQQWALEELRPANAVPNPDDLGPYLGQGDVIPEFYCPADSTRKFINSYDTGDLITPPECKIELSHVLN